MSQTETSPTGQKDKKCPKQKRPQWDKKKGIDKKWQNKLYLEKKLENLY